MLKHDYTRLARWKQEGFKQFAEDYAMSKAFSIVFQMTFVRI